MKKFFIIVCFIATVFDGISTMLGLCVAAKVKTVPGYVFTFVGALIVVGLMVSTRDVWRKRDAFHLSMRWFWGLALAVNMAAVFLATSNHIILERPLSDSTAFDMQLVRAAGLLQLLTIIILTAFLTAAPVGVSHLWNKFYEDEEDEEETEATPAREAPPKVAV